MLGLARLADRGPVVSAALAAALILAALWAPVLLAGSGSGSPMLLAIGSSLSMLLLICSAAVVSFTVLRRGEQAALQVVVVCVVLLLLVSFILYRSAIQVPMITAIFWLPAIVASVVLARSIRLDLAVLALSVCGVMAIAGILLFFGDMTAFWQTRFAESIEMGSSAQVAITAEQADNLAAGLARMMTGAMGVSVVSVSLCALFLARYWQAALVNPGGFGREFHSLSLGRPAALICVLVVVMSVVVGGQWWSAIAMVMVFTFFIQGLAVMHSLVRERGLSKNWLLGIYILLMVPHTVLLLAALGLADNVFRLRRS